MDLAESILVIVNLLAGFGCAIPLARLLGRIDNKPVKVFSYFAVLVGMYFVECVAVIMAMGTPVFSIGLAFLWGVVFGLWLRAHTSTSKASKTSFFLSLYSSLPASSFIVIPVITGPGGRPILNSTEGFRFGIPGFLPWPSNTILGFYAVLVIGALVFKTAITMGEVRLLIHFGEKSMVSGLKAVQKR